MLKLFPQNSVSDQNETNIRASIDHRPRSLDQKLVPLEVKEPSYFGDGDMFWLEAKLQPNLVSAAIRLVPLGQSDGQRILSALETQILAAAERAASTHLDDLVTSSLMAEICSMQHETQHVRLFRS